MYDASISYAKDPHVTIGNMNKVCQCCLVLKWPNELWKTQTSGRTG